MNSRESLRHGQILDLISETFHRGRKGNAAVTDSLCSHPEFLGDDRWYGFRCWQRRPDGLYRRVQSTRVRTYRGWGPRATLLGAWVDRTAGVVEQIGVAA